MSARASPACWRRTARDVLVADIDAGARRRRSRRQIGGRAVDADDVLFTACDVLAPCAVARVISDETVDRAALPDRRRRRERPARRPRRSRTRSPTAASPTSRTSSPTPAASSTSTRCAPAGTTAQLRSEVLRIGERVSELLAAADASGETPLARGRAARAAPDRPRARRAHRSRSPRSGAFRLDPGSVSGPSTAGCCPASKGSRGTEGRPLHSGRRSRVRCLHRPGPGGSAVGRQRDRARREGPRCRGSRWPARPSTRSTAARAPRRSRRRSPPPAPQASLRRRRRSPIRPRGTAPRTSTPSAR